MFSLDKKKIYPYKKNGKAIKNYKDYGPYFGDGTDLCISYHGIQQKHLWTNNHLPIQVMNISEIKMPSLNVMEAGFLRLNMKYFKSYLLNNIYYFIYIY